MKAGLAERPSRGRRGRDGVLAGAAVLLGAAVAYVDSRPHWDDSGVTAAALFVVCLGFGAAAPRRPWLWALLVGTGVPLVGVLAAGNYGSLLALLFSFAGAYSGMAVRRTVAGATG